MPAQLPSPPREREPGRLRSPFGRGRAADVPGRILVRAGVHSLLSDDRRLSGPDAWDREAPGHPHGAFVDAFGTASPRGTRGGGVRAPRHGGVLAAFGREPRHSVARA